MLRSVRLLTDAKLSSESWHSPPLSVLMRPLDVRAGGVCRVPGYVNPLTTVTYLGDTVFILEVGVGALALHVCFLYAVKGYAWTVFSVDEMP